MRAQCRLPGDVQVLHRVFAFQQRRQVIVVRKLWSYFEVSVACNARYWHADDLVVERLNQPFIGWLRHLRPIAQRNVQGSESLAQLIVSFYPAPVHHLAEVNRLYRNANERIALVATFHQADGEPAEQTMLDKHGSLHLCNRGRVPVWFDLGRSRTLHRDESPSTIRCCRRRHGCKAQSVGAFREIADSSWAKMATVQLKN